MSRSIPYNGHKNKACWNVSLWLSNDEQLYKIVSNAAKKSKTKEACALIILDILFSIGIAKTPDGVAYTHHNIREAIKDWG